MCQTLPRVRCEKWGCGAWVEKGEELDGDGKELKEIRATSESALEEEHDLNPMRHLRNVSRRDWEVSFERWGLAGLCDATRFSVSRLLPQECSRRSCF